MGPEQLLSLAISGWLLGSPSAEARPETAISLWKTRQMVLEYLQESDSLARKKILDGYLGKITPRVDLDEIAQMIDNLPPVEPARDLTTDIVECKAGTSRSPTTYHLKLPPEYTHNRHYPVLIVLPDIGVKPTQMLDRFARHAADHGYILAAPQWARGLADDYGFTEREHDTVLDTIRDLRRRFQVDSDRIFLFGLGEGGKMAFDVGLAHPDFFAGVLPMAAGPNYYPKRCWRNAQYLPFYVVNGTRGSDSQTLLRDQFTNWITRSYPALWVEYKGRGTEFFSAELPMMFDWMRHQKRIFPLRQLGTDGNGTSFGNEFCTMRPEDNRFYWLSTSHISPRYLVSPDNWNNLASPAALTGRIDLSNNEVVIKTQGINELTIWFGRNPAGQYMIDFDKPMTIRVGFRAMWVNRRVTPSLAVLLDDLYRRGDRKHLFVAKVDLNLR
jgi:pimeloyl-ACP methyl ester carboxylesterase